MANAVSKYGIKEGDILYDTWGWEQTNVEFYQVKKILSACKVELVKIGKQIVRYDSSMSGECIPDPSNLLGDIVQKMVVQDQFEKRKGTWHIKIDDYTSLTPWGGQPVFWSCWY